MFRETGIVFPEDFYYENAQSRWEGGERDSGTYVDVAFHVPNEDEVSSAGVADVGVNGDGTPRVSLNRVGELRRMTGGEAVSVGPGAVDETGRRRGCPKHVRLRWGKSKGGGEVEGRQSGEKEAVNVWSCCPFEIFANLKPLGVLIPVGEWRR